MELRFSQEHQGIFQYLGLSKKGLENGQTDPLDQENVKVKKSLIPNSGEGLFAKKNLEMGSVIAQYSGYLVKNVSEKMVGKSREFQEDLHKNLLSFNKTHSIDIPTNYVATLGHKANHSFKKFNARFGFLHTPR